MKKTLAIVLALVMVLAMIPAMSADVVKTETVTGQSYTMRVWSVGEEEGGKYSKKDTGVNSLTLEYDYEKLEADVTGKWTEDTKMGAVRIVLHTAAFTDKAKVTIDGKALDLDTYATYDESMGLKKVDGNNTVCFPIELTKAGYTDTFLVEISETIDDTEYVEIAKVSLKLVNTHPYKDAETAKITNIASTNKMDKASVYIVGDKLYVDSVEKFVKDQPDDGQVEFKVTFADENGAAFTGITYAYDPVVWNGSYYAENNAHIVASKNQTHVEEVKLADSAAAFIVDNSTNDQKIKFVLETKAADYETKAYTVKMRYGIIEEDPKGIYFAETTKTIAMGETYTPVVMGVKTGKAVAAGLVVPADTDKQVVDIINDGASVIGTREGIAYITATYTPFGMTKPYTASSMKIVVTLPGESIPELDPAAETYYVTCRALNVRAGGSTSYKKVDLIHRGDAVKVVEIANGWAKLADGTYVCAKYISK